MKRNFATLLLTLYFSQLYHSQITVDPPPITTTSEPPITTTTTSSCVVCPANPNRPCAGSVSTIQTADCDNCLSTTCIVPETTDPPTTTSSRTSSSTTTKISSVVPTKTSTSSETCTIEDTYSVPANNFINLATYDNLLNSPGVNPRTDIFWKTLSKNCPAEAMNSIILNTAFITTYFCYQDISLNSKPNASIADSLCTINNVNLPKICQSTCKSVIDSIKAFLSQAENINLCPNLDLNASLNQIYDNCMTYSSTDANCVGSISLESKNSCGFKSTAVQAEYCRINKNPACCIVEPPPSNFPLIVGILVAIGVVLLGVVLVLTCAKLRSAKTDDDEDFLKTPVLGNGSTTGPPSTTGGYAISNYTNRPSTLDRNMANRHSLNLAARPATLERNQANNNQIKKYTVLQDYLPNASDELDLRIGDVVLLNVVYNDGWGHAYNETTNMEGALPLGSKKLLLASGLLGGSVIALYYKKNTKSTINNQLELNPSANSAKNSSVDQFLKKNEKTLQNLHFNTVNSNDPCEDRYCESYYKDNLILGIFDGHGGYQCSEVVSKNLPLYIAKELETIKNTKENKNRKDAVTKALKNAFLNLDHDLLIGNFTDEKGNFFKPALAGSCAIVAYFDGEKGEDLYIASTGDCRAVLGKRKIDGNFEAIQLSEDQTIKNPHEYGRKQRMLELHPEELNTLFVKGRVLGGLMPTRAFGDARYKWPLETMVPILQQTPNKKGRGRSVPPNYKTPPYVTEPEVVHYKITQPHLSKNINGEDVLTGDLFLLLACDGIYDELSSEEAVECVNRYLQHSSLLPTSKNMLQKDKNNNLLPKYEFKKDENCMTNIIRNSLLVAAREDNLKKLMAIPAPNCRRYRDDMTGYVLFFNNGQNFNEKIENIEEVDLKNFNNKKSFRIAKFLEENKI
ncbi:hypothetical protein HK099_004912 [Clydaea vesicula]|uniref:PPM-type phosphatase domain-containing protein n=1 Tax=Clydaea vesicula TaxID=447962 RepID=A0AAD5XVB0_9FUNG|nr:hypothetical protein HK099_004912 [Clydaea vesicula]